MVALTLLSAGLMIGCGDEDTTPETTNMGNAASGAAGGSNPGLGLPSGTPAADASSGMVPQAGGSAGASAGDDWMDDAAAGSPEWMDDSADGEDGMDNAAGVDSGQGAMEDAAAGAGGEDVMEDPAGVDSGEDVMEDPEDGVDSGAGLADDELEPVDMMGGGAPTFARVVEILNSHCSPCHTAGSTGNADLRPEAAYTTLTSAPAFSCASTGESSLVGDGGADNSLLIQKIEGSASCGGRMPPAPMAEVPGDEVTELRAWIDAGAPQD